MYCSVSYNKDYLPLTQQCHCWDLAYSYVHMHIYYAYVNTHKAVFLALFVISKHHKYCECLYIDTLVEYTQLYSLSTDYDATVQQNEEYLYYFLL